MRIEVLISVMNQINFDLIKKANIHSDALMINQCDSYNYREEIFKGNKIRMISNSKRGLSKSRNEALLNAIGDICLLCDDDVTYKDNYVEVIEEAFKMLPDADIIVFNTIMNNYSGRKQDRMIKKISKSPRNKYYGSVRIAFKLKSFYKNNIWFNLNFGAGSIFSAGEESLMLIEARKKGLKIYEYPAVIASVDYSESTWFNGYNEKFFFDIGAWLSAAYPKVKHIIKFYYPLRLKDNSKLTQREIIKYINQGMKSYCELYGFKKI